MDKYFDFINTKRARRFIPSMPITDEQAREWALVRTALLQVAPYWSHLLYTMLSPRKDKQMALFTDQIPVAATDDYNVLINPGVYFSKMFTTGHRVFILGHEISHAMFGHCGVMHAIKQRGYLSYPNGERLPFDEATYQIAMDYFINAMLKKGGCGIMPNNVVYSPRYDDGSVWSIPAIYKDIFDHRPCDERPKPCGGHDGQGEGEPFDVCLEPGEADDRNPGEAASNRPEGEWRVAISGALNVAKARGKVPIDLVRQFEELMEPEVDWTERVLATIARKVGFEDSTWRSPDRRWIARPGDPIYFPSRTDRACSTIVVAIDDSGSIGKIELTRFFSEMSGVMEQLSPERVVVIWCACSVQRVDIIEDFADLADLYHKGAPGTGGTAFEPVFEEVEKLSLDDVAALIYLTDGEGSFPAKAPSYPVIWGSILRPAEHYPFGDVVMVPINKTR